MNKLKNYPVLDWWLKIVFNQANQVSKRVDKND